MSIKVLFLSRENAARSQIAEHLLNYLGKGRFEAYSAGNSPASTIDPLVVKVLEEVNIDASAAASKPIRQFEKDQFDYVINICDQSTASCKGRKPDCPNLEGQQTDGCWGFRFDTADMDELQALRHVREQIATRLNAWIPAVDKPTRALQKQDA